MTKALANEWAPLGLNVNAIAPGYVATDTPRALQDDPDRAETIRARIPQGRWGRAEDFAGPVVFLASAAADDVNGEILVVDGGWIGRRTRPAWPRLTAPARYDQGSTGNAGWLC